MNRKLKMGLAGVLLASATVAAQGKVAQVSTDGFVIVHSSEVQATPEQIWAQLVHPERWWSKAHSWSGNAASFSLTPRMGGCFGEKLADSGFAEHARIIHVAPAKMLRLSGALGPLQGEALTGTLTFTIKAGPGGTSILDFEYVVGGYSRLSLPEIAPAVDGVLAEQHRRLLRLIANGRPD